MFLGKEMFLMMQVIIFFAGVVVSYLWSSIVIRYMLKRVGYSHPNFAFVPFLNIYAMSDALPGGLVMVLGKFEVAHDIFKFWWLISFLIMFIPVVGPLVGILLNFGCLITIYTFFYKFFKIPANYVFFLSLISVFIPFVFLIIGTAFMVKKL